VFHAPILHNFFTLLIQCENRNLAFACKICFGLVGAQVIFVFCSLVLKIVFSQLKSSLLLHIDGTSPVAEDIGRQVQ